MEVRINLKFTYIGMQNSVSLTMGLTRKHVLQPTPPQQSLPEILLASATLLTQTA